MGSGFDRNKLILIDENININFPDNYFDVIVSWQVLYYNSLVELNNILKKLYSLLKVGGCIICTMARKEDHSIINSDYISKYERVSNNLLGNQAGSRIIAVENEHDIKELFKMYNNIEIGYFETKLKDITGSHWVIYGEK